MLTVIFLRSPDASNMQFKQCARYAELFPCTASFTQVTNTHTALHLQFHHLWISPQMYS